MFAALAAHGDLARHLRRLRRELADRRRVTIDAVTAAGVEVQGDAAGAHVVVPLPDPDVERSALAAAAERGVALDGLERHHSAPPTTSGVALGYAGRGRTELERGLAVVTSVLTSLITGGRG